MNTKTYDVGKFTEQERQDWVHYGIIPGPIYNNFDVCQTGDYVCSFITYDKDSQNKIIERLYDLYIVESFAGGQSCVIREDDGLASDYHSGALHNLFAISHDPWKQALYILTNKGRFNWTKNKE